MMTPRDRGGKMREAVKQFRRKLVCIGGRKGKSRIGRIRER